MNNLLLGYRFNMVNALGFDYIENEKAHLECAFSLVEASEFPTEQFDELE